MSSTEPSWTSSQIHVDRDGCSSVLDSMGLRPSCSNRLKAMVSKSYWNTGPLGLESRVQMVKQPEKALGAPLFHRLFGLVFR